MNCETCFDEKPFHLLVENCEVEVVHFEPKDRVVVQLRCTHGGVRRHSISWNGVVDWEWFLEWMLEQKVGTEKNMGHCEDAAAAA